MYNLIKDLNVLLLVFLIKGKWFWDMISWVIECLIGYLDVDLVDFWILLYVVVSNFSKVWEEVFICGFVVKLLIVLGVVFGVFLFVLLGDDFLVDGGNFNNFFVDVMCKMGVGFVIGVDFFVDKNYILDFDEILSFWELLWDKF